MAEKLTKAQMALLADMFETDGFPYVECQGHEWRTATSLAARGLLEITGERSEFGTFEARGTGAGRAVLSGGRGG